MRAIPARAFLTLCLSGCAAVPSPASPVPPRPLPCADARADVILSLDDLAIHPSRDAPARGLWVCGRLVDGRFAPAGDVVGDGELGEAGAPGWVELCDQRFHGAQTGRPPFPPYLEGYLQADGSFLPSTRRVAY